MENSPPDEKLYTLTIPILIGIFGIKKAAVGSCCRKSLLYFVIKK